MAKLVSEAGPDIKESFEALLSGQTIKSQVDEQIVYNQLENDENAIWSFLLASGYLKVEKAGKFEDVDRWSLEAGIISRQTAKAASADMM